MTRRLELAEQVSFFDPPRRLDEDAVDAGHRYPLIRQPDGRSWPWGWGACQVDTAPADWRCDDCGKRPRGKHAGRHWYLFGGQRCTPCARSWCEANWSQPTTM